MHDIARVSEREETSADPRWGRPEEGGFAGLVALEGGAGVREDDGRPLAMLRASRRILQLEAELADSRRELESQIARDPVTGLWTRPVILDLLVAERARSRRVRQSIGLFLIEVDGLPAIDQRLGRIACDEVLRAAGRRIASALRPYDVLARHGDSSFLAMAPGVPTGSLDRVLRRMTEGLAEPIAIADGSSLGITCSCSALAAPYDWTGGQEALLEMIHEALGRARTRGGGRVEIVDAAPKALKTARR
jgi:two-component system cell cycle response regulator